ncbi:MAG: sulfatase [Verrucomicrobiota bacterium]
MFVLLTCVATSAAAERPNFVFFLVDDLGWADVGCFGSTFHETPHIDALAESGMKFTNAYAAASICSPTRASIMTGRHPVRVNITDWIPGAKTKPDAKFKHVDDLGQLPLKEVTIAEQLKENGYATFFAGKWHLGSDGFLPTDQGFDINIGGHDRGSPPGGYYGPYRNPYLEAKEEGEYLTERLTEESIAFMQNRDKEKPFLLYLSYYNVHTPIQPYKKRIDHYLAKAEKEFGEGVEPIVERNGLSRARQDNAEFASMVAAVDDSVGAITSALEELNIADNTVVIFFSDNGGLCTKGKPGPTSNLPLRSGKGWLYEGGIREPTIVRAPGLTKPGSICYSPVVSMDFFPTMLEIAGLDLQPDLHADGISITNLLKGEKADARELNWHYPHYHGSTWAPGAAIRDGDWKLIEFWEFDEVELYNLAEDPGEQTDLSAKHPERVQQLLKKSETWRKQMKAKMPELNPDAKR